MKWVIHMLLFVAPGAVIAEVVEVRGTVLAPNNTPIGGVNVLVIGSSIGTVTDMSGRFKLSMPEGSAVLLFSFQKQKPLKHPIRVKRGHQYDVKVVLARKNQTFNRSRGVTTELPIDASAVMGMVRDGNRTVAGPFAAQHDATFKTYTAFDPNARSRWLQVIIAPRFFQIRQSTTARCTFSMIQRAI